MTNSEAAKWLQAIKEKYISGGDEWFDEQRKIAIDLAIATLEKPQGHWIENKYPDHFGCECSNCHCETYLFSSTIPQKNYWFSRPYCDQCGAYMKGDSK